MGGSVASMVAAEQIAEEEDGRTGIGDRLEILFERLQINDIECGVRERVAAGRIVAELAASESIKSPLVLRSRLQPLLAKSAEQGVVFRQAFDGVFGAGDAAAHQLALLLAGLGAAGDSSVYRRQWEEPTTPRIDARSTALTAFILAALFAVAYYMMPRPAAIGPAALPAATGGQLAPATSSGSRSLVATDVEALVRHLVVHVEADGRTSLVELSQRLSASDVTGGTPRGWITRLARHIARDPRERFDLEGDDLRHIVNALAEAGQPGRFALREDVDAARAWTIKTAPSSATPPERAAALPPPSEASIAPWWLPAGMLGVPLLVFGGWHVRRRLRRKDYLRSRTPERPPLLHDLIVRTGDALMAERNVLHQAARRMSRTRSGAAVMLDEAATVEMSARAAGNIRPVFRPIRHAAEYLALITRRGEDDHSALRMERMARDLEKVGLDIVVCFMAHDANLCYTNPDGAMYRLDELSEVYPQHALLFLGSGDQLLNPETRSPWPWASAIERWPVRAILTPRPHEEWNRRELSLAQLFGAPPMRATSRELLRLSDFIELQRAPNPESASVPDHPARRTWAHRPLRWLDPATPDDDTWNRLQSELKGDGPDRLGAYFVNASGQFDQPAYWWLAACAIYPAVRWDLTVYLGLKLAAPARGSSGEMLVPLYTEERALRLAELPWFRHGQMPDWLRRRLIDQLPERIRNEAVRLLQEILDRAVKPDGSGFDDLRLRIARDAPDLTAERPERDEVFLDTLSKSDPLALRASHRLSRLLRRPDDPFAIREWLAAALFVTYWCVTSVLVPWPQQGPFATGAWLAPIPLLLGWFAWRRHGGRVSEFLSRNTNFAKSKKEA